ncbi:MAG: RDD family protein [Pseudomonadota bacterium]|nr:RDD family protein [Pseudomonadota bacterium]
MQQPPPLPSLSAPPELNPYAAPAARVDDYYADQLVLADRLTRLLAVIVDFAIMAAIIGIGAAIVLPEVQKDAQAQQATMIGFTAVIVVALLALMIVNLVLLHRYGQTIGKRVFSIKVVRLDGSHCSLLRYIFARWLPVGLLGAIPLLGPVISLVDSLMIFRNDQRCMHDLIADTIVVKA